MNNEDKAADSEAPSALERRRVQFDFTEAALKNLDDLKVVTESSTRAEVVRKALKLLRCAIFEGDGSVYLKDKNGAYSKVLIS